MKRPDEPELTVESDQREAHQRRLVQRQRSVPFTMRQILQEALPLVGGQATPVQILPRQSTALADNLSRLFKPLPEDCRTQHPVAFDEPLPGLPEQLGIEIRRKGAGELTDIDPGPGSEKAVEEDPSLERRQWVDVLDPPLGSQEPVELPLIEAGEGEVRRGVAGYALLDPRSAMGDQCQKPLVEPFGQGLDGGELLHMGVEIECHAQTPAEDAGVDVDRIAPAGAPALRRAAGLARERESRSGWKNLIELAKIVEAHLGRRQIAKDANRGLSGAQIAQKAIANAPLRNGAQVLLHGFDRLV